MTPDQNEHSLGPQSPDPKRALPPFLKERLQRQPEAPIMACLGQDLRWGIVVVVKAPTPVIEQMRDASVLSGSIEYRVCDMPTHPVTVLDITLDDESQRPVTIRSFMNGVDSQEDGAMLLAFSDQDGLILRFYDEQETPQLSKGIEDVDLSGAQEVISASFDHLVTIPQDQRDFDAAVLDAVQWLAIEG